MKTAVSIPDEVFEDAERLAKRFKESRSKVYTRALAEYVARHAPDRVTEQMNSVVEELPQPADGFVAEAARRTLGRTEW